MTYTPVTVVLNSFTFDSLTASPAGVRWSWQDLSGWFDTADQRFDAHEYGTGVTPTVDRRNGRPITLTVLAHNPTSGMQLDDLMYVGQRTLKASLRAAVDVPVLLKVNEPTVPLQSYVRQTGPMRSKMLGTRHMVQFQIPLIAPDPRRYAQTASAAVLTSGTTAVTNNGDLPTAGIFTITGVTANPQIRNTSLTGSPQIIYGGTLGGGDTLVIDVAEQTVLLNGADARANLTLANWWEFKAGSNSIFVNNNTSISFRDAYS